MRIVVFTAVFGGIEPIYPPCPVVGAKHVCFTDSPNTTAGLWAHELTEEWPTLTEADGMVPVRGGWDIVEARPKYSMRKMARWYKCHPHILFPNADVTMWLDGNVRLRIPARMAVKRWLKGGFAIFDHPDRNCLYQEALFCQKRGKGSRLKLRRQMKAYRKAQMPQVWGLAETKCVIRRNTDKMAEFNEAWWKQINKHSLRDQVSLPYVCWKMGLRWDVIPGRAGLETYPGKLNHAFWYTKHTRKM